MQKKFAIYFNATKAYVKTEDNRMYEYIDTVIEQKTQPGKRIRIISGCVGDVKSGIWIVPKSMNPGVYGS